MPLKTGDVIRVWDRRTNPAKFKRHICICPEKQLFFRINSKPLFPPHMILRAIDSDFLDYDSYIELQQLVRHYQYEIEHADVIGRLNSNQIAALSISVSTCTALSEDWKEFIIGKLRGA